MLFRSIPADIIDVVGSGELFVGFDTDLDDASVMNAKTGNGKITRLVGCDLILGDLAGRRYIAVDFFVIIAAHHRCSSAFGAFHALQVIMFPDGDAGKEDRENEQDNSSNNMAGFKINFAHGWKFERI